METYLVGHTALLLSTKLETGVVDMNFFILCSYVSFI
jgi:hypothetical protein